MRYFSLIAPADIELRERAAPWRWLLLALTAAALANCEANVPEQDLADCARDAYKAMPSEAGRQTSAQLEELIERCMAAKGYRLDPPSLGACTPQQSRCYTR
jgi:hypothetical protein